MKKVMDTITVTGKRWFQSSYGNTYHSVTIWVNDEELYSPFSYGYEDAYKQTAHRMLLDEGYDIPEDYHDFLHSDVLFNVYDVKRKKDL